jgi:hypothetical protein
MPARDHRGDRRFQRKRVNRKMPMCRFDSELVVRKRLLIRAGGHVSGNITYGEIGVGPRHLWDDKVRTLQAGFNGTATERIGLSTVHKQTSLP